MIKLVPSAFSPTDSPAYPSTAFPASFSKALAEQLTSASSPDTSASSQQHSFPSIKQAFAAARHSAALLACAPSSQQKRAQAVRAAVERLEAEMAVPHASLLASSSAAPASASAAAGPNPGPGSAGVKRAREDDALSSPARPSPRAPQHPPTPYWSLGLGFSPGGTLGGETITPPAGFWATDSADVLAAVARSGEASGADGTAGGVAGGPAELDELTIESLIGTDRCAPLSSSLKACTDSLAGVQLLELDPNSARPRHSRACFVVMRPGYNGSCAPLECATTCHRCTSPRVGEPEQRRERLRAQREHRAEPLPAFGPLQSRRSGPGALA